MPPSLDPRLKRALAVTILLAIGAAAWRFAVWPLIDGALAHDRAVAAETSALASYRSMKAEQPGLEQRLAKLQAEETAANVFLSGGPGPQAVFVLQRDIKALIESETGTISSSQPLPQSEEDGFDKVGVRFEFTAYAEDLQRMLYRIETSRPFYFAGNVSLRSMGSYYGDGAGKETPLAIRLDVHGYAKRV